MALIHVYPVSEDDHHTDTGADCWCEPEIQNYGQDEAGRPARVFVHRKSVLNQAEREKHP